MVDATDSKSVVLSGVLVQVLPEAPSHLYLLISTKKLIKLVNSQWSMVMELLIVAISSWLYLKQGSLSHYKQYIKANVLESKRGIGNFDLSVLL
jgi:hypothetical protein